MPQPQIHRHEKPPIPWTSISMSRKREAVQSRGRGFVDIVSMTGIVGVVAQQCRMQFPCKPFKY